MPSYCLVAQTAPDPTEQLASAAQSFQAGRFADAEGLCLSVLDRLPHDPAARRQLGLIRLVSGDPASCQALLLPLQHLFANDPDVAIALAEAGWAITGPADAIAHYRRALALAPDRLQVQVRLGLALLLTGQPTLARQELERVTNTVPDAQSLTYLGMALLAEAQPAAALSPLRRAAELDSLDPGSVFHIGQALCALHRIGDALPALAEAVRRGPDQAHLRFALGDALFASGEHANGKAQLRQAAALDPAQPLAWAKLGDMEQLTGNPLAALGCYRRATALDGNNAELRALLGNALLAAGDEAGFAELGRSMVASWSSMRRTGALRVGILAAPGTANTPTSYIVDRSRFAVAPIFLLDGFDYAASCLADRFDVLFNAVSDPDAAPGALTLCSRVAASIGLPVANPPCEMPATTRERMAERLGGIRGLHMPRTLRLDRAALARTGVPGALTGPVLVRPTGSHGGQRLTVAHTAGDVRQAASALPGGEVHVTEFVDVRSCDGLYRKLRIVFVDGQAFPVHLAIGDQWLSHYFRTGMADPAWRTEEAAFLADHAHYLGEDICRALDEVQVVVGLDYFGIDAAIGPDGRLVVFECNASMLVRHADRPAMFDYKRKPAERIRTAVGDMLGRVSARDSVWLTHDDSGNKSIALNE